MMVHLRPARTTVVLLLSLIAIESFFSLAQREMAMHKFENEVRRSNEEFGEQRSGSRKWVQGGRKMGKNFDGLVPFSSDYRVPKNHPPKNN